MLRILDHHELEGYVFSETGGPRCELFGGRITDIRKQEKSYMVKINAKEFENGVYIERSVWVSFIDRGPNRKMCATRLIASKAYVGAFISVLTMYRNDTRIVMEFRYNGLWRLKGYAGEKNVLIGKVQRYEISEEYLKIQFEDKKRSSETFFVRNVSFTKEPIRTCASRYLTKDDTYVICICGPEQKFNSIPEYECKAFEVVS